MILLLSAAALAAGTLADWVPARWISSDPASLALLDNTPINCLLVEPSHAGLAKAAAERGVSALAVIRPGEGAAALAQKAAAGGFAGVVLEGDFGPSAAGVRDALAGSKTVLIEILPRRSLQASAPLFATYQGVWPGIPVDTGGSAKAGPTGSPWVNTNLGFLLFARAWTDSPIWIAQSPPADQVLKVENYLQAIGDAALAGARWVLTLDPDFRRRLLERDAAALADWKRIAAHLRYFETHREWRKLRPTRDVAVLQDADTGALVTGGILDMIAVKHTPMRVVPRGRLSDDTLRDARVVLNLQPAQLSPQQKEPLSRFYGLTLTAPPEVKLPVLHGDQITTDEKDIQEIDFMWRGISWAITQQNLGAKLFHAAGMLSRLLAEPDGKRLVLQLVNYTNYPVENVTVRFPGQFQQARLLTPEADPKKLEIYDMDKATAVDIDQVPVCATIIVE